MFRAIPRLQAAKLLSILRALRRTQNRHDDVLQYIVSGLAVSNDASHVGPEHPDGALEERLTIRFGGKFAHR